MMNDKIVIVIHLLCMLAITFSALANFQHLS